MSVHLIATEVTIPMVTGCCARPVTELGRDLFSTDAAKVDCPEADPRTKAVRAAGVHLYGVSDAEMTLTRAWKAVAAALEALGYRGSGATTAEPPSAPRTREGREMALGATDSRAEVRCPEHPDKQLLLTDAHLKGPTFYRHADGYGHLDRTTSLMQAHVVAEHGLPDEREHSPASAWPLVRECDCEACQQTLGIGAYRGLHGLFCSARCAGHARNLPWAHLQHEHDDAEARSDARKAATTYPTSVDHPATDPTEQAP